MKRNLLSGILVIMVTFGGSALYFYYQSLSHQNVTKEQVVTNVQDVSSTQTVARHDSETSVHATSSQEELLIGSWVLQGGSATERDEYRIENGRHIYRLYEKGVLQEEGSWSLQDNGMLSIFFDTIGQGYVVRIEFDKERTTLTYYDEEATSTFVKLKE